jgi:hypothetical protein
LIAEVGQLGLETNDTSHMQPTSLETVLFLQALAALVARRELALCDSLQEFAEKMLRESRPRARA